MKEYTEEQKLFLKQHYKGNTYREVTDMFNHRFGKNKRASTIKRMMSHWGVGKGIVVESHYTDEQLTFLFVNKDYTYTVLTEMFNKRFNTKKTVNAIRGAVGGRGWGKNQLSGRTARQLIYVKGKTMRLDIYVWECVNGPLPPGYTVIHLDNDEKNNQIGNLKAAPVTIKYMFGRAGGADVPKALAPALYAMVMLKNLVGRIEKSGRL